MPTTWRMIPAGPDPPYILPPTEERHLGQLAPPAWPAPSWWNEAQQELGIYNVAEFASIQDALDNAVGTVWLPPRTYDVATGLTADPSRVAIYGPGAIINYTGSGVALTIQQPNVSPTFESPQVNGIRIVTSTGATGILIEARTPASQTFPAVRGLLQNVRVSGFSGAGIKLDAALSMVLLNCYAVSCQDGLLVANTSNATAVIGGAYRLNSQAGIHVDTSVSGVTDLWVSPSTVLESNTAYGLLYDGTGNLVNAVIGGHYENNGTRGLYFNGGSGVATGLVESAIHGALISMPNGATDTGLEIVAASIVMLGPVSFANNSKVVLGANTRDVYCAAPIRGVTVTDNGKRNEILTADSVAGGSVTGVQFSNLLKAKRWAAGGTNLAATDVALGAGWGNTATAAFQNNSADGRFRLAITANGAGIAANPTLTLTFVDGTWSATPHGVVSRGDIVAPIAGNFRKTGQNATTWTITFSDLPVAGSTYICDGIAVGQ